MGKLLALSNIWVNYVFARKIPGGTEEVQIFIKNLVEKKKLFTKQKSSSLKISTRPKPDQHEVVPLLQFT